MLYELKKKLRNNQKFMYWLQCYRRKRVDYLPENSFEIVSRGDALPEYVVYEIKHHAEQVGFYAMFLQILEALYVADRLHFTPYVTITNSHYNEKKDNIADNAFEYFFQQPCELTCHDVELSSNVIKSFWEHRGWLLRKYGFDIRTETYKTNDKVFDELVRISQKYIHYRNDIEERLQKDVAKVIGAKKTIAIHYRGTDFKIAAPGHPVMLIPEDYYAYMNECISQGYEQFFLATDDKNALEQFVAHYPGRIVYYEDTERADDDIGVFCKNDGRENNQYLLGFEVVRDVYTMAACEGLICGNSNVTISVRIEKASQGQSFAYEKIIDKGTNADNSKNYRRVKEYWNREETGVKARKQ